MGDHGWKTHALFIGSNILGFVLITVAVLSSNSDKRFASRNTCTDK